MGDGYEDLRAALDGQEPTGFEEVADEDLHLLARRIRGTLEEHRQLLERETEESLRHVPRLVRPAVRRIVGL